MATMKGKIRCPKCGRGNLDAKLTIRASKSASGVTYQKHTTPNEDGNKRCPQGGVKYTQDAYPQWARNAVAHLPMNG